MKKKYRVYWIDDYYWNKNIDLEGDAFYEYYDFETLEQVAKFCEDANDIQAYTGMCIIKIIDLETGARVPNSELSTDQDPSHLAVCQCEKEPR